MDALESEQVLEVHATDKGAKSDLSAWAKAGGHTPLEMNEDNGVFVFFIQKK